MLWRKWVEILEDGRETMVEKVVASGENNKLTCQNTFLLHRIPDDFVRVAIFFLLQDTQYFISPPNTFIHSKRKGSTLNEFINKSWKSQYIPLNPNQFARKIWLRFSISEIYQKKPKLWTGTINIFSSHEFCIYRLITKLLNFSWHEKNEIKYTCSMVSRGKVSVGNCQVYPKWHSRTCTNMGFKSFG